MQPLTTPRAPTPGGWPTARAQSAEILEQRLAQTRRERLDLVAVLGMIHPGPECGAPFKRRDHRGGKLEPHEMHRRGLLLTLALQILICDGSDARKAYHLHPAPRSK